MQHLKLKRLTWKAAGRFEKRQEIDFDDLGSLNQIDGINHNTGGSSGSGKTTVLKTISYLLGIDNKVHATKLQSRLTKDKLVVEGDFEWNGREIKVRRSRADGLEIYYPDKKDKNILGATKVAEEKLREMLGVPPDVFRQLMHKKQKERGYFLRMTPGDKYSLLSRILGMEGWISKTEKAKSDIDALGKKISSLTSELGVDEGVRAALKEELDQLEPPGQCPVSGVEVERLQHEYESSKSELDAAKRKNAESVSMIPRPKPEEKHVDRSRLDAINSEMQEISGEIYRLKQERSEKLDRVDKARQKLVEELASLEAEKGAIESESLELKRIYGEIEKMKSKTCPTCMREWDDENSRSRLGSYTVKFKTLKETLESRMERVKKKPEAEEKLRRVSEIRESLSELSPKEEMKNNRWQTLSTDKAREEQRIESEKTDTAYLRKLNEYNDRVRTIERKNSEEERSLSEKVESARESYEIARNGLRAYENLERVYADRKCKLEKKVSDAESKAAKTSEEIKKIESDKLVAEEAVRAIKSFTIQRFKDSLNRVADLANDMLSKVPNTAGSTVYFDAFKLKKDGSISEEVTAYVSLDGEQGVPLDTLCGGEETAFELAIDLGFTEMIEEMAAIGFNLYFMDEPFDGMDDVCVEGLVEMLRGCRTSKKLVILSHAPAIKELADRTIMIERKDDTSTVRCIS